jgi:hypothetical protein
MEDAVTRRRGVGTPALRLEPSAPTPAAAPAPRFVDLAALAAAVGPGWAPVRLAESPPRGRTVSPRLPHAVALHLALEARQMADGPLGAVVPDVARLAGQLGTHEPAVADALDALRRAGVLHPAPPAATADGMAGVALAPAVLVAARRCAALLDWPAVAFALAGSPTGWVAAHVLAERLEPGTWTHLPHRAVEEALGGVAAMRTGLAAVCRAGLVEQEARPGKSTAYRFASRWLAPDGSAPARRTPAAAPAARGPSPIPAPAPPAPSAAADAGTRLVIGGVTFRVPAGEEVEVQPGLRVVAGLGADGLPVVRLEPRGDLPSRG